ncbi:MAG: thiamine phosphate synthase [Candidatus Nitronauta litoralis]|uniref:Thiamine-phosphate synthase n=1 Tax=Candidatus Nitronauta litoralis TaxID=2705533 RepID=A0A7T0FZU3_9BACT|nr:MAG: thiamine phosphate synthase [Candidatus Nitronauta litoralis]
MGDNQMSTRLIRGSAEVQSDWLKMLLISDTSLFPDEKVLEAFEQALEGGVRDIQLREKNLSLDKLFSLALVLRQMTERYEARLIINDRLDIALMVDADGVHLPEAGLPANEVKARYPHLLVGVSCHSLESAKQAQKNGADYITFSPVFDTPSKQQYGPPQGLEKLKEVSQTVSIPVLALGGIDLNNLPDVQRNGAHGIALIRGIWASDTIKKKTQKFMEAFKGEPL